MVIWYLLACQGQEEQRIVDFCRKHLSRQILRDVFVPTYERMRRYEGGWHLEQKLMFPDNIFLESEEEDLLIKEIKKCSSLSRQRLKLKPMTTDEEQFLRKLCGEMHHMKMSRGIVIKGTIYVTEGPLKGMEKQICKIDRHKRLAKVKPELECRGDHFCYILAGLEIKEKVV